jgi:phosphohistidine phosphatase SixA
MQLHQHLPHCPTPQQVEWLAIDTSMTQLLAALHSLDEQGMDDIWLVGHEPTVSELIANIIATDSSSFCIKKASMSCLQLDFSSPITGQLLWSLPCSLMR